MEEAEKKHYPEVLEDVAAKIEEMLIRRYQIGPSMATDVAFEVTEILRRDWGGFNVYVPKGRVERMRRDEEIYRRFNGPNKHELCREFGLTEQRLYQIVNAIHETRQHKLPFEAEKATA